MFSSSWPYICFWFTSTFLDDGLLFQNTALHRPDPSVGRTVHPGVVDAHVADLCFILGATGLLLSLKSDRPGSLFLFGQKRHRHPAER